MKLQCPDCRAQDFYVKDQDNKFNISEFSVATGKVEYVEDPAEDEHIPVSDDTEIYCDRCAWHDKFNKLQKIT